MGRHLHGTGRESLEPITLGAVPIAILVLIITTQLVRNLPALLEPAILQHLELTPGHRYAITTITGIADADRRSGRLR